MKFCAALLITVVISAICQPLLAAPVQNVSYEQFEQLVKQKTSEIPELQNLWAWKAKYNEPVYLGGGILRGLLRWLEESLRTSTFEEVKNKKVPSIRSLLIQKDADLDLFDDNLGRNWFQKNMPEYGDWDILTKGFREQSVLAGGPAIEKVRVSPDRIDDPLNGLRAFYEGKLTYVDAPEAVFSNFRKNTGPLNSNMKSALVLRALRFANDMPSAEIDIATSKLLRSIIESELSLVKPQSYWIQKALTKFHTSTGKDITKTLKTLRDYGILKTLAEQGYGLGDIKSDSLAERKYLLLLMPPEEITNESLTKFKISTNSITAIIEAMKHLLAKAKDGARILWILHPVFEEPDYGYRVAIGGLINDNLELFQRIGFNSGDIYRLALFTGEKFTLIALTLSQAKSPNEFFEILFREVPQSVRPEMTLKLAPCFMNLNPTTEQLNLFKSASGSIAAKIAVMKIAIQRARSSGEFLDALSPGIPHVSESLEKEISDLIRSSFSRFMDLNPSPSQIQQLKKMCVGIDTTIEVAQQLIVHAKSAEEFLEALIPGIQYPSEGLEKKISNLIRSSVSRFMDLNPSHSQILQLKKKCIGIETAIDVTQQMMARAKTAGELLNALAPGKDYPSREYLEALSRLARQYEAKFLALNPTDLELTQFKEGIPYSFKSRRCLMESLISKL